MPNQKDDPSSARVARSGLSRWSLGLGIVSLLLIVTGVGLLLGIPAVICGHRARSRIKHSGGRLQGAGVALGGLITGYLSLALFPLIILLAIHEFPRLFQGRAAAMRETCIRNLDLIDAAKAMWVSDTGKTNGTPPVEELNKYLAGGMGGMICPKGGSYTLNPVGTLPVCSERDHNPLP